MGGTDLGVCANIFRVLFVIANIVYMCLGLAAVGVGSYSIVKSETYSFVTGNDVASGAGVLIAVGAVIFIVGGIGVLGAIFRWRPLLVIYAIFWTIAVTAEIAAAIASFYYSNNVTDSAKKTYREGWTKAIMGYEMNEDMKNFVDLFQSTYDCCGFDGPMDWPEFNPEYVMNNSLPMSCRCRNVGTNNCANVTISIDGMNSTVTAYNEGCYEATASFVQRIQLALGIVGIIFALIEVLGIIVAIGLCCCITKAKGSYEVV